MISFLINYLTLGVLAIGNLERTKNLVSYITAKNRSEYLQKYNKEMPYAQNYSAAVVFVFLVVIWPLTIPVFFVDAKNPEEDFTNSDQ